MHIETSSNQVKISNITVKSLVSLAPLAGITDFVHPSCPLTILFMGHPMFSSKTRN